MAAFFGFTWGSAGGEGQILCGRKFQNSLEESSLEEVKKAIRSREDLSDYYEVGDKYIKSKDGRISFVFAGLERNVDSVKSKAGLILAWVDEAEGVVDEAWTKLGPSVRGEGDEDNPPGMQPEIWVTWNPELDGSDTDVRFRKTPPLNSRIVQCNWRDNPWFSEVLRVERENDLAQRPDECDWIWEGGYKTAFKGAYYAKALSDATVQNRIAPINPDPLLETRSYWDIGGTGQKADATAIWIAQIKGAQLLVLDYYEAVGQPLSAHIEWLRENNYKGVCVLPHDGANAEKVHAITYQSALNAAGLSTVIVQNQGRGAAMKRVEAARRVFPNVYFDPRTEPGRKALAWYHEKRDEVRKIGLGPEHDWSSHASDAFGMMCQAYLENSSGTGSNWSKPIKRGLAKV